MCKELGRITQGWGNTIGTNTVQIMTHEEIAQILSNRVVTYTRIVCDFCPQKEDPNRVQLAVGGNLIDCPFNCTTRTADVTTGKIMWNSIISTQGAQYAVADVNFFICVCQ